jgi:hypothetical protein
MLIEEEDEVNESESETRAQEDDTGGAVGMMEGEYKHKGLKRESARSGRCLALL